MIHTGNVRRVEIYHNISGESPEQIKAKTGCTTIVNGMLFNPNGTFCCKARINGKTVANDNGVFWGYGWNGDNLPVISHSDNMLTYDNYITSIHIAPTIKRGRTAISFYNGKYTVLCTSDSNGAMTIPQVEETMRKYNSQFLILDGGGSSYLDCPSGKVDTSYQRKAGNKMYLLIWEETEQKKGGDKMRVCLDAGHGTKEMNQSPDGRYIEHEFALDMANRIKEHLIRCGVDVKLTREDSSTPSLTERANIANRYNADLFVSLHSNAIGGSGWSDNTRGLSVWTYAAGGERDRAAKLLLDEMKQAGVKTFGNELYHQKFTVLAKTNMPAYLIEYAFHTSHPDVELLLDDAHRDKLALATAKAICAFGGVKWVDVTTSPTMPSGDVLYRVQVGAFRIEQNAIQMMQELENKGYKPFVVKEVKQ